MVPSRFCLGVVLAIVGIGLPPSRAALTVTCVGRATFSAVGPHQAHGKGALYSRTAAYSIEGGTVGTVAVKHDLLGLTKPRLREYGAQILVFPEDSGVLTGTRGPTSVPYTVSDFGDQDVQDARGVRFDVYRWGSRERAYQFGIRTFTTRITFPVASGGRCPAGWHERK
jgi:hypothetical protein